MEIKTCEQYVLAELEKAQVELAKVKEKFKNYTDATIEGLTQIITKQDAALDVLKRRMTVGADYGNTAFHIIFNAPWSSDYNKQHRTDEQSDFETLVSVLGLEYPVREGNQE